MNRLFLFVLFMFFTSILKAQTDKTFDIGLGGGAITTYAGAKVIKSTAGYYGNISYYLSDYFDVSLEGQFGKLAGGDPHTFHLNFINKYQAGYAEAQLHFGALFDDNYQGGLQGFISNFYAGAGFGLIYNNVTQINYTIDHSYTTIPIIPLKFGYLWTIKAAHDEEIIKVNFSYSANASIGRGIDGYFGSMPQAEKFYVFYAIGLEYTFDLTGDYGGKKIKF